MPTVSCALAIRSNPQRQAGRQNLRQPRSANLARGEIGIIGYAHIGQAATHVVEDAVTGGGVFVTRLSDRSEHGEPSALRKQRCRLSFRREMVLRRRHRSCMEKCWIVGVSTKRQSTIRSHEALLSLARAEDVDPCVRSAGAGVDE